MFKLIFRISDEYNFSTDSTIVLTDEAAPRPQGISEFLNSLKTKLLKNNTFLLIIF